MLTTPSAPTPWEKEKRTSEGFKQEGRNNDNHMYLKNVSDGLHHRVHINTFPPAQGKEALCLSNAAAQLGK